MLDNLDLDKTARAHADELNKSIDKIAQNVLLGLCAIGLAILIKK